MTATAKDIFVAPISSKDAAVIMAKFHYSHQAAVNPSFSLGVFIGGSCEGAMQFGPSLQKSHMQPLVEGTGWNGFLELNRMAFGPALPRNSESRALAIAMKIIKKSYPHIDWIISFADGTRCGDGTIYRASGFLLTGIKRNTSMWQMPDGFVFADIGLRASSSNLRKKVGYNLGEPFSAFKKRTGCVPVPGFQLRYMYFLKPGGREKLTVPVIPFSQIDEMGAAMYKGKTRASNIVSDVPDDQSGKGGANPTDALHSLELK